MSVKLTIVGDLSPWEVSQITKRALEFNRPAERPVILLIDAPDYNKDQVRKVFAFLDPPMETLFFQRVETT